MGKILEGLVRLKDYVPLLQTLTWAVLATVGGFVLRRQIVGLVETVRKRIESGSSLKAGPIEVGADLRNLPRVEPHLEASSSSAPAQTKALLNTTSRNQIIDHSIVDRSKQRDDSYQRCRGIFLAHVIAQSVDPNQLYDIFVYLIRHKSHDFGDVECAEFFFGKYWGNEIFREDNDGGVIGLSTSAYGPFLCTCLVTFKDGQKVMLERYIDFEMGKYLSQGAEKPRGLQPSKRHKA